MTKWKKRKKLKNNCVGIRVAKTSDFPHAPPLLAIMFAGDVYVSKTYTVPEHVTDGHD